MKIEINLKPKEISDFIDILNFACEEGVRNNDDWSAVVDKVFDALPDVDVKTVYHATKDDLEEDETVDND